MLQNTIFKQYFFFTRLKTALVKIQQCYKTQTKMAKLFQGTMICDIFDIYTANSCFPTFWNYNFHFYYFLCVRMNWIMHYFSIFCQENRSISVYCKEGTPLILAHQLLKSMFINSHSSFDMFNISLAKCQCPNSLFYRNDSKIALANCGPISLTF